MKNFELIYRTPVADTTVSHAISLSDATDRVRAYIAANSASLTDDFDAILCDRMGNACFYFDRPKNRFIAH